MLCHCLMPAPARGEASPCLAGQARGAAWQDRLGVLSGHHALLLTGMGLTSELAHSFPNLHMLLWPITGHAELAPCWPRGHVHANLTALHLGPVSSAPPAQFAQATSVVETA